MNINQKQGKGNTMNTKVYKISDDRKDKRLVYVGGERIALEGHHLTLDGYSETCTDNLVCVARHTLPAYEKKLAENGWAK